MNVKLADSIFKAVEYLFNKMIKTLKYNYCIIGRITTNNGNGTYVVTIDNDTSTISAMNSNTYAVGDIVWVMIINNNFSDKKILCKR